jgi:mannosyltransferase OCH1-like enzyme
VLWDDAACDALVTTRYPRLVPTWARLDAVQRADFFRYIVLHEYGGVYADADVDCLVPIVDWARAELRRTEQSIDVVLGAPSHERVPGAITAVEKMKSYDIFSNSSRVAYGLQFVQWVMATRPRHPVTTAAIARVVGNCNDSAFFASGQTEWLTGPSVWTNAVVDVILARNASLRNRVAVESVSRDRATYVGDLAILPKPTLHYKLVMHHYAGTWRSVKDPFKHFNATTGEIRKLESEFTNDTLQMNVRRRRRRRRRRRLQVRPPGL